ncbi:competence protein ComEA [Bacillus sp. M6-12]|uniref:helix-hairpin-helix domain-containing protein n=1 Tax=Bacillus sp. M6-12 TaxID=2054166 RepID=UPI000C7873D7|nr:helix-hairpin-helix domain-containing protein [Bacillus sp. M6-12]PLS15166.1 competence protein ComEA [Bacillus sp. M6-12]
MSFAVKNKKVLIGILAVLLLFAGFYFYQGKEEPKGELPEEDFPLTAQPAEEEGKTGANNKEEIPAVIKVDVKGAVHSPGVYTAAAGDRVIDLIADAGNFTAKADKDKVNLAQSVVDQMVIYVPETGEQIPQVTAIPEGSAETVKGAGPASGKEKVNLNTAELADLETLPGIGPAKAAVIIEYRNQTGFKTIEDLKNISGIGDKTFEKLKDFIIVQ